MEISPVEEKWWLDSTIVRKALLLIFPAVGAVLSLFKLPFPKETQDGILTAVTLLVTAYVGITLMIDRWKASRQKKPTVVDPITLDVSKANFLKK